MNKKIKNIRAVSTAAFSFLFAYLLSFLFEGQVLYSVLNTYGINVHTYIFSAIIAHLTGLFSCGYFVKTQHAAKQAMTSGMMICILFTVPFFFTPSVLWLAGLIVSGYISGCCVASWGHFLKVFTKKNERIKSCAEVLIFSNIIMIAVNVVAINVSCFIGLALSMLCLVAGIFFTRILPVNTDHKALTEEENKITKNLKKPMIMLFSFVAVITVNSGLMYQVINPAFEHLTGIVSWYWAVPYIAALAFMRSRSLENKRTLFLYAGMGMFMAAFIAFMLLDRNVFDYLVIDTLMLGACGIFDLFWWSIIGEMLDYTSNPAKVFGIGLSANVFGVLCGDVLGVSITSVRLAGAEITVIALSVVCITLVILPPLNRQLIMLLKSHSYLTVYEHMDEKQQINIISRTKMIDPLTEREKEVLVLILTGKSNKKIASVLSIAESTVKSHARNIYAKYDVASRAELISTILKNQADTQN